MNFGYKKDLNNEKRLLAIKRGNFFEFNSEYPWGNSAEMITGDCVGQTVSIEECNPLHKFFYNQKRQIIRIEEPKDNFVLKAGAGFLLKGVVENLSPIPFFNLQFYGVIFKISQSGREQEFFGDNLVDELMISESLNLSPGQIAHFSLKIKIPDCMPEGYYAIELALNQDRRFPICGKPYFGLRNRSTVYDKSRSITFKIKNEFKENFWGIDKKSIKIAEKGEEEIITYPFLESIIHFDEANISFDLVNSFPKDQEALLILDLMNIRENLFSRFLDKEKKGFLLTEKIKLKAKQRVNIKRKIILPAIKDKDSSTGYFSILYITAVSRNLKSMAIRHLIFKKEPYQGTLIRWPGISKFPIKRGEKFDIFTGFTGYRGKLIDIYNKPRQKIRLEAVLIDKQEEKVGELLFNGYADEKQRAWKNSISAPRDLNYLKLQVKIYNETGLIDDQFTRVYDYEKLVKNK